MDSPKISNLNMSKPTIASRRTTLSSQRSISVLSINTSAAHHDSVRKNKSTSNVNRLYQRSLTGYCIPPYSAEIVQNSMSPEELSTKIADNFQQFSNILTQLSSKSTTKPNNNNNNSCHLPLIVNQNDTIYNTPSTSPHLTNSMFPQTYYSSVTFSPLFSPPPTSQEPRKKEFFQSSHDSLSITKGICSSQLNLENSEASSLKLVSSILNNEEGSNNDALDNYAVYFKNALDNVGNTTRLRLIAKWFNHAASTGNIQTMQQMLVDIKVDVNSSDDERTKINPLMYISYFGYIDCLNLLLNYPSIEIDQQDKKGWTALIWAVHGEKEEAVRILLKHSANTMLLTKQGRTAVDYSTSESIKKLLGKITVTVPASKINSFIQEDTSSEIVSVPYLKKDVDLYYKIGIDGYDYFLAHQKKTRSNIDAYSKPISNELQCIPSRPDFNQLIEYSPKSSRLQENKNLATKAYISQEEEQDIKQWEDCIKSSYIFSWNQCLPDQMLVFSQDDVYIIVESAFYMADPKLLINEGPLSNRLWQPANIIFLSARFAHYCHSKELLNSLLMAVISKLTKIIKTTSRDIQSLAFWVANMLQLLNYLKKDPGLSVSTQDSQADISDLVSNAYTELLTELKRKFDKILEPSLMDYDSIEEMEQISFVDNWQRFFKRRNSNKRQSVSNTDVKTPTDETIGKLNSSINNTTTNTNPSEQTISSIASPHSITNLLQQVQSILQSYYIPSAIIIQIINQIFHYLSDEVFNRILTYKKYLCRSKALQIRMNISILEDWVHKNKLPTNLNYCFEPLIQLLQLLQCLSQMNDVTLFSSTVETFDKLNALQVKRCVQSYRYEVSETRLSEQIEKMVNKEEKKYQVQSRTSVESYKNNNINQKQRSPSTSSLNSLIDAAIPLNKKMSIEDNISFATINNQQLYSNNLEDKQSSSFKYMLPSCTTPSQDLTYKQDKNKMIIQTEDNIMLYFDTIYKEIKLKKQEEFDQLDKIFPSISEEWLYYVDKKIHAR
ncbi:DIL domain-containing protein [Cokeromyces recurvatus]|uniref:DIL domain-containing protein n=1 Tax=Cokeromyces recurvatus TaxID=90255 RepID=UPI00222100F8|nr:DIL domain-containing protein [Cokeromyces recurvatus]KAI7907010.1 DIL domain-containing protein [Cokeromyces recurvatus]